MNARRRHRLARLLDIRRLQEAARRQEYGLALRAEEAAATLLDSVRGQLASAQRTARERLELGPLAGAGLRRLYDEIRFRERLTERREAERARAGAARRAAERAYREARRDSLSLEKLGDRERERTTREESRREQAVNDEAALRRFLDENGDRAAGGGGSRGGCDRT